MSGWVENEWHHRTLGGGWWWQSIVFGTEWGREDRSETFLLLYRAKLCCVFSSLHSKHFQPFILSERLMIKDGKKLPVEWKGNLWKSFASFLLVLFERVHLPCVIRIRWNWSFLSLTRVQRCAHCRDIFDSQHNWQFTKSKRENP